jgi:hypothetical protein
VYFKGTRFEIPQATPSVTNGIFRGFSLAFEKNAAVLS